MKSFIILLLTLVVTDVCYGQMCNKDLVLQEGLEMERLVGNWSQLFYNAGSLYEGVDCFHLHVTEDAGDKIKFLYHFTVKNVPDQLFAMESSEPKTEEEDEGHHGSRDDEEVEFIGNHLASDYENFLILYMCTEQDGMTVDVQIKAGVRKLGREVRRKMNKPLRKLGLRIKDLTRVPFRYCDKKNII